MVRMTMAAAAAFLAIAVTPAAAAVFDDDSHGPAAAETMEAIADAQMSLAEHQFARADYARAVDALAPVVEPQVFEALTETEQYDLLGLYARALYAVGDFGGAHEATIDLTGYETATSADWALRLEAAKAAGDEADAAVAAKAIADADDADWNISTAA